MTDIYQMDMKMDLKGKITGKCATRDVYVNNHRIPEYRSQRLRNHSPDGFSWGYAGSGPAQLALAVMLLFVDEDDAMTFYQEFKFDVISTFETDKDFEMDIEVVKNWIKGRVDT